jgi:uncharacterized membrane protein
MDHVESVVQSDDRRLHWKATIAGVTREWTAEITEQTPDQRVAWHSLDGTKNSGVVSFHALDDEHTRVVLQLEIDPEGFLETVADKLGFVSSQAEEDLVNFKRFIERRGVESGGYRGTIERGAGVSAPHPNEHAEGKHVDAQA